MSLNDWKREAEQYRDIDRAVLQAIRKPVPARLSGRCASGAEKGKGYVYHAVPGGSWQALCGKEPGRLSGGWCEDEAVEITCSKCRKLAFAQ